MRRRGTKADQWDKEVMHGMQGVPWEPVPGREGVEVKARVEVPKNGDTPAPFPEPEEPECIRRRPKIR